VALKQIVLRGLRYTPRLEDRVNVAAWRRRPQNHGRMYAAGGDPAASELVRRLRRDGIVITDADAVFGDRTLFDEASAAAEELYERRPVERSRDAKSFLTVLTDDRFALDHPFARLALHPRPLAIANAYVGLRTTLRALSLWLTYPTEGPPVETQLWHRDGDDVLNLKMFVYFTDVTRAAGPLCYARGSQPLGPNRKSPEQDELRRSNDDQLRRAIPDDRWLLAEGPRGTVVFADTCGYHKQLKPESDERVVLNAHYVSGAASAVNSVEFVDVDGSTLDDDRYVAVFDRPR
jgi:Phytanoyl-CoA dioxygenase (PhyH)